MPPGSAKNIFTAILYFAAESALFSCRTLRFPLSRSLLQMNTLGNSPAPGHLPHPSVEPVIARIADIAAAVVPAPRASSWHRLKDTLVTIYAYGLLGFGIFFPFILAAWHVLFEPAAR
jgi:hypothetical protein